MNNQIFNFDYKILRVINMIEEFEQFLSDNLGWNNKTKTEEKEKESKEKTEDKKGQTEDYCR